MSPKRILFCLNAAVVITNVGDRGLLPMLTTGLALIACVALLDDGPRGWRL